MIQLQAGLYLPTKGRSSAKFGEPGYVLHEDPNELRKFVRRILTGTKTEEILYPACVNPVALYLAWR